MDVKQYERFSDVIRAVRKEKRMSQREMARALSVSAGYVGQWELGLSKPSADVVRRICKTFELSEVEYVLRLAFAESAPDHWAFDPDEVHVAVMVYARHQASLVELSTALVEKATAHGCTVVASIDGAALSDYTHPSGQRVTRPVHFGYSDGLSQPEILPAPDRAPGAPPAVPPGMFVLGHPDSPQDGSSFVVANDNSFASHVVAVVDSAFQSMK